MHGTEEVLRIQEVLSHFRERFVLLDRCRFDDGHGLTHGRVVRTSTDRDEVYRALRDHPNSVIIFTGEPDDEIDGAFLDVT